LVAIEIIGLFTISRRGIRCSDLSDQLLVPMRVDQYTRDIPLRRWEQGMAERYAIITDFERPSADLIARAAPLYYCLVGGAVGQRQVMDPGIKPLDPAAQPPWRVCGPAFTVRPEDPDDLLMGQIAGKYVKPGDVVVVDAVGARMACWGGSMAHGVKAAGAAGLVMDGYVLTADVLRVREDIPVFCRGTKAISGEGKKPGWINGPVICGGVIVHPGDLILGDADGVVVVPRARAEEVIGRIADKGQTRSRDGSIAPRDPNAAPYYRRVGAEETIAKLQAEGTLTVR
jgi:regulator of RNase E activity RraA